MHGYGREEDQQRQQSPACLVQPCPNTSDPRGSQKGPAERSSRQPPTSVNQPVTFRLANPGDADALSEFSCADRGQRYTRDVEALIHSDVADDVAAGNDELRVNIATNGDVLVGVIAHSLVTVDTLGDVQFIHALGVHPDYRRRWIATLLKQQVLDYAHATGTGLVVSQVHRRNHPMLELNRSIHAVIVDDPDDGDYYLNVVNSAPAPTMSAAFMPPLHAPAPPDDDAGYAQWVNALLDAARQALLDVGLNEVTIVDLVADEILQFSAAEHQLLGQALVVQGTTGFDRTEHIVLVHYDTEPSEIAFRWRQS